MSIGKSLLYISSSMSSSSVSESEDVSLLVETLLWDPWSGRLHLDDPSHHRSMASVGFAHHIKIPKAAQVCGTHLVPPTLIGRYVVFLPRAMYVSI